jgi:branched-chain amino acid transport system permease protein
MGHAAGYWLQQALNIVQLASFYLPLALAFALIQGITRRVFLSLGNLAMFGSFAAIYVCLDSFLRGFSDGPAVLLSLVAALLCGAAMGIVVSRLVLGKALLEHPMAFMIASVGLAIVIQEVMRLQSMSRNIWIPPPFQGQFLTEIGGSYPVRLSAMTWIAAGVSIFFVLCVLLMVTRTSFGRQWRASAQSRELSSLCGVDVNHVAALTFGLSGALAGLTGWTSSISYGGASFSIGLAVGFKAMFASVIGGFGTLRGACLGAFILAAVEVLWSAFFPGQYREVAVFTVIIVCLILKPEGLLGEKDQWSREQS